MYCTIHQQREAAGICVYCGKFFCEECLIEIDGKYYCKEHIKVLITGNTGEHGANYDIPPGANSGTGFYGNVQKPHHITHEYMAGVYSTNAYLPAGGYTLITASPKSRMVALLLCLFFGCAGFHRFYAGKIGTGLIWMFTCGFFFVGYMIDIILIACGTFRDERGLPIKIW